MKRRLSAFAAAFGLFLGVQAAPVSAQNFWLGEIVAGGWTFCPRTTIEAAGQLLPIAQNSALFSLYGTIYGGDGRTSFGVPDLRGRNPIGHGHGPGLSDAPLGQRGGAETHTPNIANMASHSHIITNVVEEGLLASPGQPTATSAAANALSNGAAATYTAQGGPSQLMRDGSVNVVVTSTALNQGGGLAYSIRDPYLAIRYCVVTQGLFPSRN